MGISDRGYMFESEEGTYDRFGARRFTAVNTLIIINIIVWVFWQFAFS
jgi:hypothetical protein